MRSMRSSRSSAAASGATTNGSTGARRKRDFVFMPPILCREFRGWLPQMHTEKHRPRSVFIRVYPWPSSVSVASIGVHLSRSTCGLERIADAAEERGAVLIGDGIVRPRGAAGDGDAEVVGEDGVERQLAAGGRADVRRAESRVPCVAGVEEPGGAQRVDAELLY